jgi:RNA polymerase sigma-70 factor (ECF subfamily)
VSGGRVIPLRRPPTGAPAEISDETLLSAVGAGDTAALGVLYDRHHAAVYNFLSRLAGTDWRDLDDFVQATFLEAMKAAPSYRGEAPVRPWLFGIAANIVSKHVRTDVRRKAFHSRLAETPTRAPTQPDHRVEQDRMLSVVQQAILDLPDRLRVVYVMCELEEMRGVEVAKVLGLREGTVWRQLHEARAALRDAIEGGTR